MRRTLVKPAAPEAYRLSADLRVELSQLQQNPLRHAELAALFQSAPSRQQSDPSLAQAEAQLQTARAHHHESQELKG